MAQLLVGPDSVTVQLGPWEQLGSFQRTFSFPRSAVESVQVVDRPWQAIRGLRVPGTGLPAVVARGTWRYRGGKDFVAVYGTKRRGLLLELGVGPFARVLVARR